MNDDIQRLIPSTTLYRRKDKLLSQENTRSKMPQTPTINSLRAPGVIIGSDASKGAATTPFKGGYPQLSPSTPVGRTLKELNISKSVGRVKFYYSRLQYVSGDDIVTCSTVDSEVFLADRET